MKFNNYQELLLEYISNPCFSDDELVPKNPYRRPLRKGDIEKIDFSKPITKHEIFSNKNLIINKILLTIYEQDLLFIDSSYKNRNTQEDFKLFYDPRFVALGKMIRPHLEKLAFDFLNYEVEIIGSWDKNKLLAYITAVIAKQEKERSELCEVISSSKDPILSSKMLLIQMAPDFLSEASAMARMLPGAFGEEQSELMKVFIDEYGYGVHQSKHSTLFEETLASANLNQSIHHYYNDYLPTSLMLVNYFHYVCSNKSLWFQYMGCLYYTEASIPHFNKQISLLLKKHLSSINTKYFDEHVHIDKYHRSMVIDKIIATSIDKYGENIIDEILFSFESFRLLQNLADEDLIRQIQFVDQLHSPVKDENYTESGGESIFDEVEGEITSAHSHESDELFRVKNGEVIFYPNSLVSLNLKENDAVVIPKGRVHATVVMKNNTCYTVKPIVIHEVVE